MKKMPTKDKTRKPRHTDAQVVAALQQSGGIMAHAARKLGLDRSTLHTRIHNSQSLMDAMVEAKETNLDVAETKLMKAVNDGELAAIFFYLKTQGKRRGYIERHEFDHIDVPAPIEIAIQVVDEDGRIVSGN